MAAQKLLYVADNHRGLVYIYSYPQDVHAGKLAFTFVQPSGVCADNAGDIWVADTASKKLVEFRHGATHSSRTLEDSAGPPVACAVDPKSGDLAVPNQYQSVLIFPHAQGKPIDVIEPKGYRSYFVAYDGNGDLFIDGLASNYKLQVLEVKPGERTAIAITIDHKFAAFSPAGLQWDGTDLAVGNGYGTQSRSSAGTVYRLRVSGTRATLDGSMSLRGPYDTGLTDFWIEGDDLIGSIETGNTGEYVGWVKVWAYPSGGKALGGFRIFGDPFGVAVSD